MKIIIDRTTNAVIAKTTDDNFIPTPEQLVIDAPAGHAFEDDMTGLYWDGTDLQCDPVAAEAMRIAMSRVTKFTQLDFLKRFTEEEEIAIYTAAEQSILVRVWLDKFKMAKDYIDITDERTISGIRGLEAAGIIGVGRAEEILK